MPFPHLQGSADKSVAGLEPPAEDADTDENQAANLQMGARARKFELVFLLHLPDTSRHARKL